MTKADQQIVKETITTETLAGGGLLNAEQSTRFLTQIFEGTPLGALTHNEVRRSKTGQLDKLSVNPRLLRRKVENIDATSAGGVPVLDEETGQVTGYRAQVVTSQVPYACVSVRLPWEITGETLRQNLQGTSFEALAEQLMLSQLREDVEDILLNGDTAAALDDPDHDFLYINDGWVKKAKLGGHVVDLTALQEGVLDIRAFNAAAQALPSKYHGASVRWLMSPRTQQSWVNYLANAAIGNGGNVADSMYTAPFGIQILPVPRIPDDVIMLTNPKNLVKVSTHDVIIKRSAEGKHAVMEDKIFYGIHLDLDAVIEETDALAIATGVGVA
ncbi:MAG: hypothetical protein LBN05_01970 [Oscillospiraceae bacterium]|jgi:hypothetical protein|nr:hypothetical protein [Oscillospiraceae bacterium]